jgi:DNA-binding CsgD family transcriptional regulator
MRKKADKYLYTAERYYFSASVAMLARQGKSIYEIALLLQAHTKLVEQFILTDELKALIRQSNEAFINKVNNEYADLKERDNAFWKYDIISASNGSIYFVRNSPKTLDYWLKKTRNGETVFSKIVSSDADHALTGNPDLANSFSVNKMNPLELPLHKTFEIINEILNGSKPFSIKTKFHCTAKQLLQLQVENNLPQAISKECISERIVETIKAGADLNFIEDQFRAVSRHTIKKIMTDYKAGKYITPMNIPIKRRVRVTKKVTKTRSNTMKISYRFSSRKVLLLQQKICLRHFSLGKDYNEIATTMGIEQHLVIALLRKARAVA